MIFMFGSAYYSLGEDSSARIGSFWNVVNSVFVEFCNDSLSPLEEEEFCAEMIYKLLQLS